MNNGNRMTLPAHIKNESLLSFKGQTKIILLYKYIPEKEDAETVGITNSANSSVQDGHIHVHNTFCNFSSSRNEFFLLRRYGSLR